MWQSLPVEIRWHIFQFFEPEDLAVVGQVDRECRQLALDDRLYTVFAEKIHFFALDPTHFKHETRQHFLEEYRKVRALLPNLIEFAGTPFQKLVAAQGAEWLKKEWEKTLPPMKTFFTIWGALDLSLTDKYEERMQKILLLIRLGAMRFENEVNRPLCLACYFGDIPVAKELSHFVPNADLRHPLSAAMSNGQKKSIDWLKYKGVNFNVEVLPNLTLIAIARLFDQTTIADYVETTITQI